MKKSLNHSQWAVAGVLAIMGLVNVSWAVEGQTQLRCNVTDSSLTVQIDLSGPVVTIDGHDVITKTTVSSRESTPPLARFGMSGTTIALLLDLSFVALATVAVAPTTKPRAKFNMIRRPAADLTRSNWQVLSLQNTSNSITAAKESL